MGSLGLSLLLAAVCGLGSVDSLAVMSVDLGSEWMKIAVVSPGVPMEICLNGDSQRKTPVVIAFRDGERLYGDLALSTQIKFPNKAFFNFLDLVGKSIDHPIVQEYMKRYPFYNITSDQASGGIAFTHPDGMVFTVEELVAMILKNAQHTAQTTTGQKIKDAVITVPAYFNQAERRALSRSVKIAGLNLLQLMNDNTAVALNYGVFRRKEFNATATNILFYDMGSSSTTATLVSYQTQKTKDRGYVETAPVLTVKGVGFDRTLGGAEFKSRLGEHLATKFDALKKTKTPVRENARAFFKLYKEAERVKKILSANTEINAQVENVMEDVDLKVPVTRQEFEDMSQDLFERVTGPLNDALGSSGIPLEEVSQVIVVGGGTRIPKIQQLLEEYLKGKGLSKNINADEAAAMGAAYQSAYLSKGFKVLTFVAKDCNLYPVLVEYSRDGSKNVQKVIFNRNNEFPRKKTILINNLDKDITVSASYGDVSFLRKQDRNVLESVEKISSITVGEVSESLQKHKGENVVVKGVRIHMSMDSSGFFNFEQAETLFEKEVIEEEEESTLSKIGSTIGKLFGGSDATEEAPKEEGEKVLQPEEASKSESNETQTDSTEKPTEDEKKEPEIPAVPGIQKPEEVEKKKVVKKVEVKEPLRKEIAVLDMPVVPDDEIVASQKKLQDLDDKDRVRLDLDKARNALESYLHETKDKLETDEFVKASTEEERTKVMEALNKEQEWLEYESDAVDTETLKGKLSTLMTIAKNIVERVNEHRERPQAVESLENLLKISRDYLTGLEKIDPEVSVFTKVELETLDKAITETTEWLKEQKSAQALVPLSESPKLTMKSIFEKIQVLDRETKYLMNKARLAPPKKKVKKEESKTEEPKDGEQKPESAEEVTQSTEDTPSVEERPIESDIPVVDQGDSVKGAVNDEQIHSEL